MEIAKLVLEYIKALAWPLVVFVLVIRFSHNIESIVQQISERLGSAETLKVGIMGSEVEISGTAKQLLHERQQLVVQEGDKAEEAQELAHKIDRSVQRLSNPISDIVGISLLRSGKKGLSIEELLQALLNIMSPSQSSQKQPPMVVITLSNEIEKILSELRQLDLVAESDGTYMLTNSGLKLFNTVAAKQAVEKALRSWTPENNTESNSE